MLLQIPRRLLTALEQHCRGEYPLEACALLVGNNGVAAAAYMIRNVHPEPERAYRIDVVDEHTVSTAAAGAGHELLAVVHSHPDTIAYPSAADIRQARPNLFYVIIFLAIDPPDVRTYRIVDGVARPVPFRKVR